jgi:AGZA family xanthine/uracil permease-like MFS transporter
MPLTFSIANGIAFGFIGYSAAKPLAGRWRDVRPAVLLLAALFVVKFALL